MHLQYHTRNIQRIEDGSRQPGVQLALRMVVAVDAEPGDFFETLFEIPNCITNAIILSTTKIIVGSEARYLGIFEIKHF